MYSDKQGTLAGNPDSIKGLGHLTPDFGLRFCQKINFGI